MHARACAQNVVLLSIPPHKLKAYSSVRDRIWIYSQISIYSKKVSYLQHWKIINAPLTPIVKFLTPNSELLLHMKHSQEVPKSDFHCL